MSASLFFLKNIKVPFPSIVGNVPPPLPLRQTLCFGNGPQVRDRGGAVNLLPMADLGSAARHAETLASAPNDPMDARRSAAQQGLRAILGALYPPALQPGNAEVMGGAFV